MNSNPNSEAKAAQRAQVINTIFEKILQSPDLDPIFSLATDQTRQALQSDRVIVYQFTPDWNGQIIAESVGKGWVSLLIEQDNDLQQVERIEQDRCLLRNTSGGEREDILEVDSFFRDSQGGRYNYGQKFLAVDDISTQGFSDCYVEVLEKYQVRAYLLMPIFQESKLWGLLGAYQNSSTRVWQNAEINFVTQVANQLAVALQQEGDIYQIRQKAQGTAVAVGQTEVVSKIMNQILQSRDLESILKVATNQIRQALKSDRAIVYKFHSDWTGQVVAESVGSGWVSLLNRQNNDEIPDKERIRMARSTVKDFSKEEQKAQDDIFNADICLAETQGGGYAHGKRCSVVNDIYEQGFPDCYIQALEKNQTKAYIIVPIFQGEKLWGLLSTYQNDGPRIWKDSEIELMRQVADPLSMAIEKAGYIQKLEEQNQSAAIATQKAQAIANILKKLRNSPDIETMFKVITRQIRRALNSDRCIIYKFHPDWTGQIVAESVGSGWNSLSNPYNRDFVEQDRLNIREFSPEEQRAQDDIFIADSCLSETLGGGYAYGKRCSIVNDIYAQGFPDCYIKGLEGNQTKAYLIVPIFQEEKLWGFLSTYQNDGPRVWQESEIDLMMQVRDPLIVAIERAEYINKLEEQNRLDAIAVERSKAIATIIKKIRHSQDIDTIFKIITQEIRQALKSDRALIYQFNPDWTGQVVAESVGYGWISLLSNQNNESVPIGDRIQVDLTTVSNWSNQEQTEQEAIFGGDSFLAETKGGRYVYGKKFSVVNDIYAQGFPDCYIEALEKNQSKAYVIVPIFQEEKLWGLLGTYQNDSTRVWQDSEIDLMIQVANQSAVALRQAEYINQLKQQNQLSEMATEQAKAVAHILNRIRHSQDVGTIFQIITQQLRQVLKSDRAIVYKFNSDWTGQVVAESVGDGWISLLSQQNHEDMSSSDRIQIALSTVKDWSKQEQIEQENIFETDTFLSETQGGRYVHGKKFSVVNDIYTQGFPDCYIEALEKNQSKAYVIVPIFQEEKLWGLLGVYQNDSSRIWQNSEIDLMIQVSTQSAVALQQAEYINQLKQQARSLEITVTELQLAQEQLIQQEKLAALGQLVAGIAHEINTPLGAIQASAGNNTKALIEAISELPKLSQYLNEEEKGMFFSLLDSAIGSKPLFSSSEKRPFKRKLISHLKEQNIDNARNIADVLIDIGIHENIDIFVNLLKHSQVDWVLDLAYNLTRLLSNNRIITTSVEKANKVVFALKNYARFDQSGEKQLVNITEGLDIVLEIYNNQLKHNIEVFRDYQATPAIWCYPDELIQVWTNLIHNGIQAMGDGGTLAISTLLEDQKIKIGISDSGSGILPEVQDRIFEPFFTTKPTGEGSGLGLHICKKIIDKHQGRITIDSEPGKTVFNVWLPLKQ